MKMRRLVAQQIPRMDAFWRAANILSAGQIFWSVNLMPRLPLKMTQPTPRLIGHWGTTPGLDFIYLHLNHIIKEQDLDEIFITNSAQSDHEILADTYQKSVYSHTINVVDLMKLQPQIEDQQRGSRNNLDYRCMIGKPFIFARHGDPWLIHRVTYRTNPDNMSRRGGKETDTLTMAFDMTALNNMDRVFLAKNAIDCIPQLGETGKSLKQYFNAYLPETTMLAENGSSTLRKNLKKTHSADDYKRNLVVKQEQ